MLEEGVTKRFGYVQTLPEDGGSVINKTTWDVIKGYHVYIFHAQGVGERAMDRLISQGFFDGVIDIVPAGLIEELFQGNRPAGMARLDAACERGIPMILAPCTINLTGCGVTRKNRE